MPEVAMLPIHYAILLILVLYIAVCFGKIAARNNRNPVLYGILSVLTPVNLIILGYWAFGERKKKLLMEVNPGKRFRVPEKRDAGKAAAIEGAP